jgi:Transposase DDE domain
VISVVDPQARHSHKTAAHGFDGDKAHVATDPDTEVICAAEVSSAATADAAVGPTLLGDLAPGEGGEQAARAVVYGDAAYGTGAHLAWLETQGLTPMVKTQPATAPGGRFGKDQFRIDLVAGRSPARRGSPSRSPRPAAAEAGPGSVERAACVRCARPAPSPSPGGWSLSTPGGGVGRRPRPPARASLAGRLPSHPTQGRAQARSPVAPPARRRRARVRGLVRVAQDFKLLAGAVNLARFAALGLRWTATGWQIQPA